MTKKIPGAKKGAPKKLGRPKRGESRKLTYNEQIWSGCRFSDTLCSDPNTGKLTIERCTSSKGVNNTTWRELSDEEAAPLLEGLEQFWER